MKRFAIICLILVFAFAGVAMAKEGKGKGKKAAKEAAESGAKVEAGNILVGGGTDLNFGMVSRTTTPDVPNAVDQEDSESGFGLHGIMGYFVIDGLEVGPVLEVDYTKNTQTFSEGDVENTSTSTEWMFGAQVGYFYDFGSIAVPYGMLRVGYVSMSGETEEDDGLGVTTKNTMEGSGYKVGPKVGVDLFFTKSIALDLGLYFDYVSGSGSNENGDKVDYDMTETDYGLAVGFNVFF